MKSFIKINSFLKIVGTRGSYHELVSRFILMENLYDELEFKPKLKPSKGLNIISNVNIQGTNIITKVYEKLASIGYKNELEYFFKDYDLFLFKRVPLGAGLGGGSSNAATFLKMVNEKLKLKLDKKQMIEITKEIGADIAFFISEFKAANVYGVGEIIEEFNDEIPELKIISPDINCNTAQVYQTYRKFFINSINKKMAQEMQSLTTYELLDTYNYRNFELNDLLNPCQMIYKLNLKENEFLSGSGSSYFKKEIR